MTIGIPKSFYVDDLEADVDAALDGAIATFRKLGVRIVQVDLPDQTLVSAAALIVIAVEAAHHMRHGCARAPRTTARRCALGW